MKLLRLSTASILACIGAVVILLVVMLFSLNHMRGAQTEVGSLFELRARVDDFSVASDSLLLHGADAGLWNAYVANAESIQADLRRLGDTNPAAHRAARQIEVIVETLRVVRGSDVGAFDPIETAGGERTGPLGLPLRGRAVMSQVAGHGTALDTSLDRLLQESHQRIARQATWIGAAFAGSALVLALVSMSAFTLVHRRLAGPVGSLSETVIRIRAGDREARATVVGDDELAELSRAFNGMIDQRQRAEARLHEQQAELEASLQMRQVLINSLPAHVAMLDAEGTILDVNDQWRQFGRDNAIVDPESAVGTNYIAVCEAAAADGIEEAREIADCLRAILAGDRHTFTREYSCHSPEQPRWFRAMANALSGECGDGGPLGAVVMHVDITERKLAEQELNRLAYEDSLTGLHSRVGFVRAVDARLEATGWQQAATVVLLDIRQLREVNDAHGYDAGDTLLRQVGKRLVDCAGGNAILARIGGDEFAIFLPERSDSSAVEQRAGLASAFARPFRVEQQEIEGTAAFGYTMLGDRPRAAEDLLREGELALYQSRLDNAGRLWSAYTPALDEISRRSMAITRDLRRALEVGEFELHFQPKVDLASGGIVSCEALLRWYHPEHGLQSPATFIPVAERSQLIGPIGAWVLDEACRYLRKWQDEGLEIVRVAVNVSLVQFMIGDLREVVARALETHDVSPGALTLEITESVFERESETLRRQLGALHDMGVRLSLDDFGTGYSSLLYLQKYPFDEIKVDRGFVRRMISDAYSRKIVDTVIGIAGALGAEAVAEGVESRAERDALIETGCRVGQGYFYSMPLEAEDFAWLLQRRSSLPLVRSGCD